MQVSRRNAIPWSFAGGIGSTVPGLSTSTNGARAKLQPVAPLAIQNTTLGSSVTLEARRVSRVRYQQLAHGPAIGTRLREDQSDHSPSANTQ